MSRVKCYLFRKRDREEEEEKYVKILVKVVLNCLWFGKVFGEKVCIDVLVRSILDICEYCDVSEGLRVY